MKKGLSIILLILVFLLRNINAQDINLSHTMRTRWVPLQNDSKAYPRPQLERNNWLSLNGKWEYAITDSSEKTPKFTGDSILVPFPIESLLSGVNKSLKPNESIWYKRTFNVNKTADICLLNFGAVDTKAVVFINGKEVGEHSGGYLSFSFDISKYIVPGNNEILVKVNDAAENGIYPHGKQVLNPGNIYYTSSSGIWQTVWIEQVSNNYIESLKITPDIDNENVNLQLKIQGAALSSNLKLVVNVLDNDKKIVSKTIPIGKGKNNNEIEIKLPNAHLWSPNDPFLYSLSIELNDRQHVVDHVKSYFGMRKIAVQPDEKGMDRIFLNNKYTYNLGILDQGFWPDGLYTAPNDEALEYDIKAIKLMGFNTIRKHIKIEPARWYYYADKLGILVWQDFVNPVQSLPLGSKEAFEEQMTQTIAQLYNHPSIVTWVLFNEFWGAYNQTRLTDEVKKLDPTRIVNSHSGQMLYTNDQLRVIPVNPWKNSDIVDVHSYPFPRNTPNLPGKAKVIGEFGGVGVPVPDHEWNDLQGWGYIQVTADELVSQYRKMTDSLKSLERLGLSASIYTQPFDVEGEENGLITYDREIIKIPLDTIRAINSLMVPPTKITYTDNFYLAKTLDPKDNDRKFDELLAQYTKGSRDSALMRRIVLIAIRQGKNKIASQVGNELIASMKSPYNPRNLKFISFITKSADDAGFKMFLTHPAEIDSVLGPNSSRYTVKSILRREILPGLKDIPPGFNWDSLEIAVENKFGEVGKEAVIGNRMIYYGGFEGNKPDWKNFSKYYVIYFNAALKHPDYRINNITWRLFEHEDDPEVLSFATKVMEYCIQNYDRSPEALDTYANLLHRTQQTQKAIEWETKAVEMLKGSRHEKEFAETLQKMKDNKPTWPQN